MMQILSSCARQVVVRGGVHAGTRDMKCEACVFECVRTHECVHFHRWLCSTAKGKGCRYGPQYVFVDVEHCCLHVNSCMPTSIVRLVSPHHIVFGNVLVPDIEVCSV